MLRGMAEMRGTGDRSMLLALPLWLRLGGTRFWDRTEGHPPHPEAKYTLSRSRIPTVRRRR